MGYVIILPTPYSGQELVDIHRDLAQADAPWKPVVHEALGAVGLIYRLHTQYRGASSTDPLADARLTDTERAMQTRITPCSPDEAVGPTGLYFDPRRSYKQLYVEGRQRCSLIAPASSAAVDTFVTMLVGRYEQLLGIA